MAEFDPSRFQRKDLSRCRFIWPSQAYFAKLDAYAQYLEETVVDLERELARNGNKYYQGDAKEWGRQWNDLQRRLGQAEAEKIRLEAEKDAEINRLKLQIEYLEEQLESYEELEKPKQQRKRNPKTGRWDNDIPKKDKMREAYWLNQQGYNYVQIAKKLNIGSTETVKRYIRDHEKTLQSQREQEEDTYAECENVERDCEEVWI